MLSKSALMLSGLLICSLGTSAVLYRAYSRISHENALLRASKQILEESHAKEVESLKTALRGLELDLDEYRLQKSAYEQAVKSRHRSLDESSIKAEEEVRKELEKDSSLEKQMELIRKAINDFSKKS